MYKNTKKNNKKQQKVKQTRLIQLTVRIKDVKWSFDVI